MLLLGFTSAVLLLCLFFIIRLYIVVKTGANCKPGSKGRVTVLVVAGSGNSAEHGCAAFKCHRESALMLLRYKQPSAGLRSYRATPGMEPCFTVFQQHCDTVGVSDTAWTHANSSHATYLLF